MHFADRKLRRFTVLLAVTVGLILPVLLGISATAAEPQANVRAIEAVMNVQDRNTNRLMAIDGVVGIATGLTDQGVPAVKVYAARAGVAAIPLRLEGVPVVVEVTGPLLALKGPTAGKGPKGGGSTVDPTSRFDRPVPIGVSTGNRGQCSAGTIACRVTDGSNYHALSNNHVYALSNNAPVASEVLQPGLYDSDCFYAADNVIGNLFDFEPIVFSTSAFNVIDAAIAHCGGTVGRSTPLRSDGSNDGYGMPRSAPVSAYLYQNVQKYGRTTSLTKGYVSGLQATVNISYSSGTARFVSQIIVSGNKGPFIKAGDSGSLLVTDDPDEIDDPDRSPVGLLFAGSSSGKYAIANPIDAVLDRFAVTVDGQ